MESRPHGVRASVRMHGNTRPPKRQEATKRGRAQSAGAADAAALRAHLDPDVRRVYVGLAGTGPHADDAALPPARNGVVCKIAARKRRGSSLLEPPHGLGVLAEPGEPRICTQESRLPIRAGARDCGKQQRVWLEPPECCGRGRNDRKSTTRGHRASAVKACARAMAWQAWRC